MLKTKCSNQCRKAITVLDITGRQYAVFLPQVCAVGPIMTSRFQVSTVIFFDIEIPGKTITVGREARGEFEESDVYAGLNLLRLQIIGH